MSTPKKIYVAHNPKNAPNPPAGYRFLMKEECDDNMHTSIMFVLGWGEERELFWTETQSFATKDPIPPTHTELPEGLPELPVCPEGCDFIVHGWGHKADNRGMFFATDANGELWVKLSKPTGKKDLFYLEAVPVGKMVTHESVTESLDRACERASARVSNMSPKERAELCEKHSIPASTEPECEALEPCDVKKGDFILCQGDIFEVVKLMHDGVEADRDNRGFLASLSFQYLFRKDAKISRGGEWQPCKRLKEVAK